MENLCATFKLFGASHFIYLLLSIAVAVTLIVLFRKTDDRNRGVISKVLLFTGVGLVVLEMIGRIAIDGSKFFQSLPVGIWCLFLYIALYTEFSKKLNWVKFGYFITLPLSALSLLIVPNYFTTVAPASLSVISFFLINSILIVYSVLKLLWLDEYLSTKDIMVATMNYLIVICSIHIFNVIMRFVTLDVVANYAGTMGEEYDPLIGWLASFIKVPFLQMLPIIAVLVIIEFVLFVPFHVTKTRKDNKAHMEEVVALGNLKAQSIARKTGKKGGSHVLVNSTEKAQPTQVKRVYNEVKRGGFVSVNKAIQVNHDENKDN